jgi:putative DNA primase/helicase
MFSNNTLHSFMTKYGIICHETIVSDGQIHRFATGSKGNKNGWYICHGEWGAFGVWGKVDTIKWTLHESSELSLVKRNQLSKQIAEAKAIRNREIAERQEAASAKAAELFSKFLESGDAPYLLGKKIRAYGIRYNEKSIIIPVCDVNHKLWSLQTISHHGNKKFLQGGKKKSCFHVIGDLQSSKAIYVCEGYATGASIYEATGITTVIAFDACNLEPVIASIKAKHHYITLTIAADNDQWGEVNTGRIKAEEATLKHGIKYVFPIFKPGLEEYKPTDFNDLHVYCGVDEVKQQLSRSFDNVTNVTDVQFSNSVDCGITDDVTNSDDDVTDRFASKIPTIEERPCYKVFDDWHEEEKKKYRPGIWYFSVKPATDKNPEVLIQQWICSPLHVDAITSDAQDNNFGRLLRFSNTLGRYRTWAMPMELLRANGDELRGELLSMGVEIDPKAKTQLMHYLQSQHPKRQVYCALQVGWCDGSFVLPDTAIGKKAFDIIFQSGERCFDEYTCAGTIENWKAQVASYAIGNPMLITALSGAFTGALLELCNAESGGIHFVGNSATGKTALIEAACSVWGGDNYKRSWRATANGMEGVSAMFNDGLLALDEISECDPKEVGAIVYSLGNGRGKQRATRSGNAREVKRWHCFVLSNGERSIETTMAEGGNRAKAGQLVRLPSIQVARKYGVWDYLHGMENGAALTDTIKMAAKKNHGHVGRTFLERLTRDDRDFCVLLERIKALPEFSIQDSEGQAKRVAGRFAIIAMAGEIATEYGLTGWQEGAAIQAASIALMTWQNSRAGGGNDEKRQILEKVSAFIERHGDSRFSDASSGSDQQIRDRAGWWHDCGDRRTYLFTNDGMREALKGFDFKRALDELQNAGVITAGSGERSKPQRIAGRTVRIYTIHAEKLIANHDA